MEVPLRAEVAVSLEDQADVMLTPGANQSTHGPWLAHEALASPMVVAEIVIASATRAGEVLQAFWAMPKKLPLPAAMA
jgi:hypothetical protein